MDEELLNSIAGAPTEKWRHKVTFAGIGKRAFDLCASLAALILLSPVFGIIALRIKRDSPGPVYFRGERVGRYGKPFQILKFRTMYETPESYDGSAITRNDDPRVTPFGKWLRKTKLNELPQLWNVLKGEMSLVGPRPEDPIFVQNWPPDIRDEILSVRPGLTSPASVTYRDEEDLLKGAGFMDAYLLKILPDKLRLDQLYVQNRSFLTDLDIIALTAIVFLPRLRDKPVAEASLYNGVFYRFAHSHLTWFITDVLVCFFAVGFSGVVWRVSTVINLGIPTYALVALVIALVNSLINSLFGLPRVAWKSASPTYIIDLGLSVGVTMFLLWIVTRLWLTEPWIPFSMIWLIGCMLFIGLVAVRYRERLFTGIANRWLIMRGGNASFAERILIVGAGDLGQLALWLLLRSKLAGLFGVVGLVDDDPRKHGERIQECKVLGSTRDIPALVEKFKVHILIYAISNISPEENSRILQTCRETKARLIIIPDLVNVLEMSIRKIEMQD
ncbi:MAG TPA: sugar transferase [Anaerolineaceae bacterium]|nr:sugar transferase [Anaerolineaceae bacterium]